MLTLPSVAPVVTAVAVAADAVVLSDDGTDVEGLVVADDTSEGDDPAARCSLPHAAAAKVNAAVAAITRSHGACRIRAQPSEPDA
jgi:hypothetical protein